MILPSFKKRYMKPILIIALLVVLAGTATGCEYLEGFSPSPQPAEEEKTEVEIPQITIKTSDKAILVVYEHLLRQAESDKAKVYLANFYTVSDKWNAESELLKDGTSMWHVVVDMTDVETWEERAYWQQASWLVLQDGEVIPSKRFQANALRIEADLQELSPPPQL